MLPELVGFTNRISSEGLRYYISHVVGEISHGVREKPLSKLLMDIELSTNHIVFVPIHRSFALFLFECSLPNHKAIFSNTSNYFVFLSMYSALFSVDTQFIIN